MHCPYIFRLGKVFIICKQYSGESATLIKNYCKSGQYILQRFKQTTVSNFKIGRRVKVKLFSGKPCNVLKKVEKVEKDQHNEKGNHLPFFPSIYPIIFQIRA